MNRPLIEKIDLKTSFESIYDTFSASPYSFFLDSSLSPTKLGQFSFIGIEPFLIFKSKREHITLERISGIERLKGNPFLILQELFKKFKVNNEKDFPVPFIGGGVGYFSYDLKDFNEKLPDRAADDLDMPDCVVCFYDTILAFDHYRRETFVISTGFPERGKKASYRSVARLESLKNTLRAASFPGKGSVGRIVKNRTKIESNFTKESYIEAVLKAKEHIKKGDIYQVNLSQRLTASLEMEAYQLYKILRTINPAPFSAFLNFGDVKIASASPERFIKKQNRYVETRPIKGTRPRGRTQAEDRRLKQELVKSRKDRAENLMIIDLERNDLGRICEYASVTVNEFMTCEEYATVFHLVSTVSGQLKKDVDAVDCLIKCFPGGSITGAPKIRSMEIIEELEPVKRSVYTGSIGYIGFDGNMDTSVVIRTFIIKGDNVYFQVGGGIVYDSDPEKEYLETLDKAKALIEAISHANSVSKQKVRSAR